MFKNFWGEIKSHSTYYFPCCISISLRNVTLLNANSVSCWLYPSSLEKHNQQLVFLIVTCEKQIALTANYFWMCHLAVYLLLLCAIQNITCWKWDFIIFCSHNLVVFHNSILLGASDEQFLFNNSMSCYNFFAWGCEKSLLKIFTRPLDLLALHDACFYLLRALFYTASVMYYTHVHMCIEIVHCRELPDVLKWMFSPSERPSSYLIFWL